MRTVTKGLMLAILSGFANYVALSAASELNVVVILDNSGSMNEPFTGGSNRITAAKNALLRVLDQTGSDAQVGVLLLNPDRQGKWLVPLGPVDKGAVKQAVGRLMADGYTPLGDTMREGADALLELRANQRFGVYKLLIVTDGEASDSNLVDEYLPEIQSRGLLVDVIGVAMQQDHSLATRTSTYRRADDPQSLEAAISQVVNGESTATDAGDAGQSDFALLAGFPSEVAAASIEALTAAENVPIGQSDFVRELSDDPDGWAVAPGQQPRMGNNADEDEVGGFPLSFYIFAGIILVLVLRAIGKSR